MFNGDGRRNSAASRGIRRTPILHGGAAILERRGRTGTLPVPLQTAGHPVPPRRPPSGGPLDPRPVRLSRVEMTELVLPNDANVHGSVLGGRVMHHVDICAAVAANRHSRSGVVTAAVDDIEFLHPVPVGHLLVLKASVNFAARTSMEVGVKVWSEDPRTGERRHTSSAYLTFVAVDREGRPVEVPPVLPEDEEDRRRYEEARVRRAARRAARAAKRARRSPGGAAR